MSKIEVPDWAAEIALAEWDRLYGHQPDSVRIRASITAALWAWVVPQHQCMCTDEDDLPNGPRDIWMDVSAVDFKKLTERNDVRGRTLYTLRQEKPDGENIQHLVDAIANVYRPI